MLMDKLVFFILIKMQVGVVVAPLVHIIFEGKDVMLLVFKPEKEADSLRCLRQSCHLQPRFARVPCGVVYLAAQTCGVRYID